MNTSMDSTSPSPAPTRTRRIRLSARIGTFHATTGTCAMGPQDYGIKLLVKDIDTLEVLTMEWIPAGYEYRDDVVNNIGDMGAYCPVFDHDRVVEIANRLIAEHHVTHQSDRRLGDMGVPMLG